VTRLALFSALMRDTTPRGLKARSLGVAIATGGAATGRCRCECSEIFSQKLKHEMQNFCKKRKKEEFFHF